MGKTGVIAGLIGSLAVALTLGIADLVLGRSLFHTPAVLGRGLAGAPWEGGTDMLDVFRFTLFHALVFVVLGIFLAVVAASGASRRTFRVLAVVSFLFVFFGSATMTVALDPAEAALPPWGVVLGNVVALGLMGAYFARRIPRPPPAAD